MGQRRLLFDGGFDCLGVGGLLNLGFLGWADLLSDVSRYQAGSVHVVRPIDLLASGAIQVEPLITAKATLDEGADWFDRLYAAEAGLMKVILQPSEGE